MENVCLCYISMLCHGQKLKQTIKLFQCYILTQRSNWYCTQCLCCTLITVDNSSIWCSIFQKTFFPSLGMAGWCFICGECLFKLENYTTNWIVTVIDLLIILAINGLLNFHMNWLFVNLFWVAKDRNVVKICFELLPNSLKSSKILWRNCF